MCLDNPEALRSLVILAPTDRQKNRQKNDRSTNYVF